MTENRTEINDLNLAAEYRRLTSPLPTPAGMAPQIRSNIVRRRHFARTRIGVALVACLAIVLGVGVWQVVRLALPEVPVTTSSGRTGPIASSLPASCAFEYNSKTLAAREWAVDATVSGLEIHGDAADATLQVHQWYQGGSGREVEARMPSPLLQEDAPPAYGIGTRLLISGDRDGTVYLGWACGFSRYYDQKTAAAWEKVFG